MILVLLGTQNNSFYRLLEEIEENIKDGTIKEEVIVQSGFTKYNSEYMKVFDMIPSKDYEEYIKNANLIITHGGAGSIIQSIRLKKKVIAVPRLSKYNEHVNDHQLEIIRAFKNKGYIIGINDVTELKNAILQVEDFKPVEFEDNVNKLINIVGNFIDNN